MNTVIALIAWVTINGFPVSSFETCEVAKAEAEELRRRLPDLQVRADCGSVDDLASQATIYYHAPRREPGEYDDG